MFPTAAGQPVICELAAAPAEYSRYRTWDWQYPQRCVAANSCNCPRQVPRSSVSGCFSICAQTIVLSVVVVNSPRVALEDRAPSTPFADYHVVLDVSARPPGLPRRSVLQHPFDFGSHSLRKIVALDRTVGAQLKW